MRILVTGGGGFLGGAIVEQLVKHGHEVRSFSRSHYERLDKLGVESHQGDLTDAQAVSRAVGGCDAVMHVAALPGIWGPYEKYYQTNVVGTENVIAACIRHKVRRLVYTSSPSVVFDGHDMEGVDESVPYPSQYKAHYPKTKAEAERKILQAADRELATVALRPHLIWGPGDNHLVPRILARGRAGRLRRIGSRNPLVDSTFIDNAASAHVLAVDRLEPGSEVSGKAYFISNGEPIPVWDLVNDILRCGGVAPVERSIPVPIARLVGSLLEGVYSKLGLQGEPPMTRFVAEELSTSHWFDLSAARKDLGYQPTISLAEGMQRLRSSLLEMEDPARP